MSHFAAVWIISRSSPQNSLWLPRWLRHESSADVFRLVRGVVSEIIAPPFGLTSRVAGDLLRDICRFGCSANLLVQCGTMRLPSRFLLHPNHELIEIFDFRVERLFLGAGG